MLYYIVHDYNMHNNTPFLNIVYTIINNIFINNIYDGLLYPDGFKMLHSIDYYRLHSLNK